MPQSLRSNQFVHVRLNIKRGIEGYSVKNFAPITIRVPKLLAPESIDTSLLFIIIGSTVGGIVLLGGAGLYFLTARKKVNYKVKGTTM